MGDPQHPPGKSGPRDPAGIAESHAPRRDTSLLADRYRLIRQLGSGGMGAVHLAEHITIQKQVAIKILHEERAADQAQKERFLNEARAIARVRHPNVIDVSDYGETEDGRVFFVMEYLQGEDLKCFMRRKHFVSWREAEPILLQICAGLGAAHSAGVIHRDLKPDNIFLIEHQGEANFVKVLDFGLAKLINDPKAKKLTRTGIIVGTPAFVAPEQVLGKKVDHRADIYGMGLILYRMLCGKLPFQAKSVVEMLRKHVKETPSPPSKIAPEADIPAAVEELAMRALAKNPDERFSSMEEMAKALAAAKSPATKSSAKQTQPWTPAKAAAEAEASRPISPLEIGDARSAEAEGQESEAPRLAFEPAPAPAPRGDPSAGFELSTEQVPKVPQLGSARRESSDGDLRPPVSHLPKVLMAVIVVLLLVIVALLLR